MSAVLLLVVLVAQPKLKEPPDWPKLRPDYTAFPDLKPLMPYDDPLYKTDPEAVRVKYRKAMDELLWKDVLTPLPKEAPLLQQVQYEQALAGQRYLKQVQAVIDMGRWQPQDFKEFLTMAADVPRVAAELAPTPAARVRCYESRVILLKELEKFIEIRVNVGTDPPQNLSTARFYRLQAEADLLKLKESLKDAKGPGPSQPGSADRALPLPDHLVYHPNGWSAGIPIQATGRTTQSVGPPPGRCRLWGGGLRR